MSGSSLSLSRRQTLAATAAVGLVSSGTAAMAQTGKSVSGTIHVAQESPRINPHIYGGFQEHIGNLINHSLWAEVLDDRKFYYPVDSKPQQVPARGGMGNMLTVNKWHPVGPDSAVVMDTKAPYVGKHSPVVTLSGSETRGLYQSKLILAAKDYTGRVVLAADGNADVTATLIWGAGAGDRQSVKVAASQNWSTQPLKFSVKAPTQDARLEFTATGSGTLRIGAVSLMPADNINGFRADTTALMKEMDCKTLRLPGGNFLSSYDWKDTIGDPDKRPPVLDPVWSFVQPNDVGVDELLQFCEMVNAEPSWAVSTGFDGPRSGAECVEYVNGSADTVWGAKRAANGRKEPYKVKYWNIGNEMYGHWQMGHMAPSQYYVKHNLFADAMRAVDPNIYIVVPGGFADEMTTGQGIFIEGQPRVEIGSERDWAYGMLKNCWGRFDALATHAYPPEGKKFDLKTGKLSDIERPLSEWSRQMANRIRTMDDCWEEYKKHFPALKEGKVKVFFDEYAYGMRGGYQSIPAMGMALHEFFRHTDYIDMAGYTMATGWLDYNRTESTISALGRLFQIYNRHFGVIPVAVSGNSKVPAPEFEIGGDQPSINAGSDTWPLDVSAALSEDRSKLIVAIINPSEEAHTLNLNLDGFKAQANGKVYRLAHQGLSSVNKAGQPPQVSIVEGAFKTATKAYKVPAHGVELYEFVRA